CSTTGHRSRSPLFPYTTLFRSGAGSRTTHAVDLLTVRIRAADDAQQNAVTRRTRHLRRCRQIGQRKKYTFRGAATHIGGRNFHLGFKHIMIPLLAKRETGDAGRRPFIYHEKIRWAVPTLFWIF